MTNPYANTANGASPDPHRAQLINSSDQLPAEKLFTSSELDGSPRKSQIVMMMKLDNAVLTNL